MRDYGSFHALAGKQHLAGQFTTHGPAVRQDDGGQHPHAGRPNDDPCGRFPPANRHQCQRGRRSPKKTEEPTKEPDEEIRKKLEQIKKQTEKNNRDYRNINLNADPKIHKSQIKVPKENDKIVSIRINERSGIIYTKTESGKAEGIALAETMYHKKSLSAILKINEMCKEIAGGRIKGLLLGTKVNPAIVYALRKQKQSI